MPFFKKKVAVEDDTIVVPPEKDIAAIPKTFVQKVFPVLAAGSGLFAEGYVQSVSFHYQNH